MPDDSYFASLLLDERRLIASEVQAIRESLSTPTTRRKRMAKDLRNPSVPRATDPKAREKRREKKQVRAGVSSDRGKIKEALSLEHRSVTRRALGWFAKRYGADQAAWNEPAAKKQAAIDPTQPDQHWSEDQRHWSGERRYAFARNYWRLVRSVGGWDEYKKKLSGVRNSMVPAPLSPSSDGSDILGQTIERLSDAFGETLGTLFPKGEQDGLSRFLYELTQLEAFRDGP